ncbi:MAG: protein rep [Okeania sp. SIO2D1]|nr:protein rep [Okeania sp. SIO2D1]
MENFTRLKNASLDVAQLYALSSRDDFERYSERILNCACEFDFRVVPGELNERRSTIFAHLQRVRWCRCRHCPLCQWARMAKWRAKFFQGLSRLQLKYPRHKWLMLTLTVRNVDVDRLRFQVQQMSQSWNRLVSRHSLSIPGYIRSLEVTRSATGQAHPHYHVLLLMPPDYFTNSYLSHQEWVSLWRGSARLDYSPVVHVKSIYSRAAQPWLDALLEVVKYSVKPADLAADAAWLYEITDGLHRTRAVSVGGLVSKYVSQKEIDRIDSSLSSGDEVSQFGVPLHLSWCNEDKSYLFTRFGDFQFA